MRSIKVDFHNAQGEKLAARLEMPVDGKPDHFALFAHCFTCSKNLAAVGNITSALTYQNIAVLRFDFTGLGESEGDFSDTNFSSNVDDLLCAAQYLTDNYQSPSILVGHSLGGAAVILAANQLTYVKAVATIGAPSTPAHVQHLFQEKKEEIIKKGKATVNIGGRPFTIKEQFIKDLEKKGLSEILKKKKFALLLMHSPQDSVVGIENAAELYQAAHHSKSFISLDGSDHLLSDEDESKYVGNVIASWAKKYLKKVAKESLDSDKQSIARTFLESFKTDVKTGKHSFVADEPQSSGGEDSGPSPYDLLASALSTCTSMTIRYYADREKWPLVEVKTHTQHHRVHADDCKSCEETKDDKIDQIDREIELEGDLSKEQRDKLLEIANKCPVHKTLTSDIQIKSSLKE